MVLHLLFVQFHAHAQSKLALAAPNPADFVDTNAPATNAPAVPVLVPQPINATLSFSSASPTNKFYLIEREVTVAGNTATFTNLQANHEYIVRATTVDSNGVETPLSGGIHFILPPNTPFISADAGQVTIRSTVLQASTLESSTDLLAWSPRAALAPDMVTTWTFNADQPAEFFRINTNQPSGAWNQ